MKVGPVNTDVLSGMQKGVNQMQEGANRVASGEDPVEGMHGVREGARQVEASTKVARAQDDAIGKLIDEYA